MKPLAAVLLAAAVSASALADGRPVAVMGMRGSVRQVVQRILLPNNLQYEVLDEWLPPSEYPRYSAIYFAEGLRGFKGVGDAWGNPEALAQATEYVRSGGVVVMTGGAPLHLSGGGRGLGNIEPLLGFGSLLRGRGPQSFRVADPASPLVAHLEERDYAWAAASAIGGVTTVRSIVNQLDADGEVICPFVAVREVGDGKVYWFAAPFMRISAELGSRGEPEHVGPYRFTQEELDLEAYRLMIEKAVLLAGPGRGRWTLEHWEPVPLGQPGPTGPWPEPELMPLPPPPEPPQGQPVALAQGGEALCAVVLPDGASRADAFLGRVLSEHLEAMIGAPVPVVRQRQLGMAEADAAGFRPQGEAWRGKSFLLLGAGDWLAPMGVDAEGLAPETMILKTVGNAVVIAGDEQGTRHAVYAFLEELGCRYLWPGELGKVVPRCPDLSAGPLDVRESPRLIRRGMRMLGPVLLARNFGRGLNLLGIGAEEYAERFSSATATEQADHGWSA